MHRHVLNFISLKNINDWITEPKSSQLDGGVLSADDTRKEVVEEDCSIMKERVLAESSYLSKYNIAIKDERQVIVVNLIIIL